MTFRDDHDALRHRIESLEREVEDARAEIERLRAERDRAIAERERPGSPTSAYPAGTPVYVEWQGRWWDAHVLRVNGPGSWRIHYDGWSSRWNEDVDRDRIAPRMGRPPGRYAGGTALRTAVLVAMAVAALVAAVVVLFVTASSPGATVRAGPDDSAVVRSASELRPGQPVWILWNGSWYVGSVVRVNADATVLVHYDGYADSYDEPVTLDRLRAQ